MTGNPLNGPLWWEETYGFQNRAEFAAAVEKYLPSLAPFGNFGVNAAAIDQGYVFPWSAPGILFQQGLASDGYTGDAATSGRQLLQLGQNGLVQNEQGATMGQLIIPDCFQVTIMATVAGKPVENVIGVQNASGNAHDAALAVGGQWEGGAGPIQNFPYLYEMVGYRAVDISSPFGSIDTVSSSATGGIVAVSLATRGACALVQWNGASRSRSTRGRLYHGPLWEGAIQSDGASLDTTVQTDITTDYGNFLTGMASAGYPVVVLSRVLSQAFLVTSHTVEATIATQRRRIRS